MLLRSAPEMTTLKAEDGSGAENEAFPPALGDISLAPADLSDEEDCSKRSVPCFSASFLVAPLGQNLELVE